MTLKTKLLFLISVPVTGLIVNFLVGVVVFVSLRTEINEVNTIQQDRATMLNGDRDAYQAFLSEREATTTVDLDALESLAASSTENLDQTRDRIIGPSVNFTDDMIPEFERFREYYDVWRSRSRTIIENARSVAAAVRERNANVADAIVAFDAMRDHIDRMGELIQRQFVDATSGTRQRELGEALSLVLNGDRDAYQAYVSQLLALEATNIDDLVRYDESNAENLQQTLERVNRAADLSGTAARDLRDAFQEQYAVWSAQSRRILELTRSSFETQRNTEDISVLSAAAFQEMRDAIDVLGEMQETRAVMMIQRMERRIATAMITYGIVVLLSFLLSVAVSIVITRSILSQLGKDPSVIATITDSIANGVLAIDFDAGRKEFVGVYASMKRMTEDLRRIIGDIDQSARHVTSSSGQLNQSAQQMAQGATEQAANAEEVSSSMEEMASNISRNTDNALQTEKIARQVARDAEEGGRAVHETVEAMQQIAEKISMQV
ncbi:MAG: methyl-accepting chemotaxis protein [Spirochaetales bacterium]|nr:methyl-accepting chemotaxis protein [Spirochaetales bacterium]